MRKKISMAVAVTMTIALMGCGAKTPVTENTGDTKGQQESAKTEQTPIEKKEPITLKLWAGIQPEYGYDELVKNFNEEFADKGIQLEYTRYVNNDDGNLQLDTYLLGGDAVDVFVGYGGLSRLKKRADANLLVDMTPHLESRGFQPGEELGQNNVDSTLIDDKFYCLPTKYENPNWIVANADMFREAGIELPIKGWTYSEYLEVTEKLTKGEGPQKVYGMFWWLEGGFNSLGDNLGVMLEKYQTYADDECTTTSFDQPVYVTQLEMIAHIMEQGWSPTYAEEKSDSLSFANIFLEGKAAMSFGISQLRIVKDLETYPHDFETALIPFPVPDETYLDQADYSGISGAGDLICVNSKTSHLEEAMDFVIWYIEGGMAPLAKGGRIPLWKDFDSNIVVEALNETPGVFEENSLKAYLSIDATNSYSTLVTERDAEISDIKKQGFQAVLLGEKSPNQAMNEIKIRCDEVLAK